MPIRAAFRSPRFLLLAALALPACDPEGPDDELDEDLEDGDLEDEELEDEDEFRVQWGAMSGHFELVKDDSHGSKATGSVEIPFRVNGQPQYYAGYQIRGSCGVTFISPHYAITAAHCVDSQNVGSPPAHSVAVKTYDISDVSTFALWVASYVEGYFPHYEPLAYTEDFEGYDVQEYSCTVTARCSYGSHNCTSGADLAMLYCPGRAYNAPWIPVAPSDAGTGTVEMYWFHELLTMPTSPPPVGSPDTEFDRWNHYGVYTSPIQQNYHYLAGAANVLLPLHSTPWTNGEPRKRTYAGGTDLFGCHGSSGSGVFQRNAQNNLELLGPAATGPGWAGTRLCQDPGAAKPGITQLTYTSNSSVRALEQQYSWGLFWDRNPIIWQPIDPPVFDPG